MKQLYAILLVITMSPLLFAQAEVPEPEFSERPYYLKDGQLHNLERTDATFEVKLKGMGIGGANYFYTVFSPHSSVRFKQGDIPRLFMRLESNQDPQESIVILKQDNAGHRKYRKFYQGGAKAGGKSRDASKGQQSFTVEKVRDGLYEIILPASIPSGEYAILPAVIPNTGAFGTQASSIKVSCFAIEEDHNIEKVNEEPQVKQMMNKNLPREPQSIVSAFLGFAPHYRIPTLVNWPLGAIGYEHGVTKRLGIGGYLGTGSVVTPSFGRVRFASLGITTSFYFIERTHISMYAKGGGMIWARFTDFTIAPRIILAVGSHFKLNERLKLMAELGYSYAGFSLGIAYSL
jgi:hypothetical protein